MNASDLEKELELARKTLDNAIFSFDKLEEFESLHREVFALERNLAAERMEEYAETIVDFPATWDVGAPMPHLLANGYCTFLMFYLRDTDLESSKTESVALVQFYRCVSVKFGDPNEEVFDGHPLNGKGMEPYTAQIVQNSNWIKELEAINKAHSQYDQEFWRSLKHYILWFHDETFECVAKSFEIEVFQKSLDEVLGIAVKRILA